MRDTFNLICKTAIISFLALILFLALSLGWNYLLLGIVNALGLPESWLEFPVFWVVLIIFILIPNRYLRLNFPISFRRSTIIDAPIAQIWDTLEMRERDDYFLSTIDRIEGDPDHPMRFIHHLDADLANTGVGKPVEVHVKVQRSEAPFYLDYTYNHQEDAPDEVKIATRSERLLSQTSEGVSVTLVEHTKGLGYFTALMFFVRNPCGDALRQLKSHCEGTPDTSWASSMMRKIKVEANGGPRVSTHGEVMTMAATAVGTWVVTGAAILWLIFHLRGWT